MKPERTPLSEQRLAQLRDDLPTHKGKVVVGHVRIAQNGMAAVNHYFFEDGSESVENDGGKKVAWPEGAQ